MTTVVLASWIVAAWYGLRAGGPRAVLRAVRDPATSPPYRVALAVCAVPIPLPSSSSKRR